MQTQTSLQGESGFSVVKLVIVLAIGGFCLLLALPVLATLAIPAMQKSIKKANETSAIASLKDITAQENAYNSDFPTHGFACNLAQLGGKPEAGAPTPDADQLIPDDLASRHKSGYTFAIVCGGKTTVNNQEHFNSYVLTAVPNSVGHSGDRGFCTDQNVQIRSDRKGGTNCTDLLQ
jgi:type IV pilus assembly protein PilA